MNLTYREINYQSLTDCSIIANWQNDPDVQKFFIPNRADSEEIKIFLPEDIYQEKREPNNPNDTFQFILLDKVVVGMFSILFDPKHKMSKDLAVAWPSILIADMSLRKKGIGTKVGAEIAQQSKRAGATHIEAGVFEYNQPIINLLEKNGFDNFDRREKVTFFDGKHWDGLRYLKELV